MPSLFDLLLAMAAAAAAAQGVPAPPPGAEYLVTMPLGDLVARTEERGGTRETDWLPPGASFDRAPRMVIVERILGPADEGAPTRFIAGVAACLRPCPGQAIAPIDGAPFQGRPAARTVIDMPGAAVFSGLPTRTYVLALSGDRALHVVIVMLRGGRSPADERFAEEVLRSVVLCTPASRAPACASPAR